MSFSDDSRRVQTESSTGSVSSSKVRTTLTLPVEAVDYDTQACVLRIKGRNVQENQYVKVSRKTFWVCINPFPPRGSPLTSKIA